ncbi:MFS transporter [Halobium salinum]|uniref:MFS transporter n=1 Tax=Halobium salinum TaxID=1364940 RepID=A0ABD5PGM3_9EURY|nr:MFS transporter [Halobium salinum]
MNTDSGAGRWRTVAAVAGWQTAASLCYYTVFAATGVLRDAFGLSEALVGVVVTAAILGYTAMLFPSGALVDGFGEKPAMVGGLVALAAAAVTVSLAPSYALLLVAAAALGAAYSTAMPASNRGIVAGAPPGRANLAMGLKQVGVTAGSAGASLVVTGVAAVAAWQFGFGVVAAVALAYAAVFALVYDGTDGDGTLSVPDLSGLSANGAYLRLVGSGLFLGATLFTALGYVVLYVQDVIGASPVVAGGVLAFTQVTGSLGRVGAGSLADRLGGAGGAAAVALGQTAVGAGLFALLATGVDSLPVALVVFGAIGLSVYGSTGVFYSCLGSLVDDDELGAATAGGQTAINAGGLVVPPLFGLLVERGGYEGGWALLAASAALAAVLLVSVRRDL